MSWLRPDMLPLALFMAGIAVMAVIMGASTVTRVTRQLHASLLAEGRSSGSRVRLALRSLALLSWAVALLGPSWGQRLDTPTLYRREVLVAADLSASMRAEDLPPSRLVRMREMAHRLFTEAPGYRYGLIVFAGDAWERVPFTYDRGYLEQVLAEVDPGDIQPQGTDMVRVLERAAYIAQRTRSRDTTVILFTDGEHTGSSSIDGAIELAKASGIRVLAVSLGLPEGAAIPTSSGGYIRDNAGEIVTSRPDRALLDRLATATGGLHLTIDTADASLDALVTALQSVEAKRTAEQRMLNGIDRSTWWIAAGWILLWLSLLPLPWLAGQWRSTAIRAVVPVLVLWIGACGTTDQGAKYYETQDWAEAARWYAGETAAQGDPVLLHNLGAALYRLEQYPVSMTASIAAATRETETGPRGDALYNAGNAAYRAGDYVRAVQLYRMALDAREDEDTRVNLEIAMRKLAELEQEAQQPRVQPEPPQEQTPAAQPSAAQAQTMPSQPQQGTEPARAQDEARRAGTDENSAATEQAQPAQPTKPEQSSVLLRKRLEELRERNALAYPDQGKRSSDKPW